MLSLRATLHLYHDVLRVNFSLICPLSVGGKDLFKHHCGHLLPFAPSHFLCLRFPKQLLWNEVHALHDSYNYWCPRGVYIPRLLRMLVLHCPAAAAPSCTGESLCNLWPQHIRSCCT